MGLRFRKSIKIAPGVKFNINKKSVGLTVGKSGVHYTVNSKGKRTASVGIPGTGLSYTSSSGGGASKKSATNNPSGIDNSGIPAPKKKKGKGCLIVIIAIFIIAGIGSLFGDDNKEPTEIKLSADTKTIYDINSDIPIDVVFEPSDVSIDNISCESDGGKFTNENGVFSFKSSKEGSYKVYVKCGDVKSNTLAFSIEDKEAKRKAEEEAKKQAELEAQKKAEEEAAAQAAAEAEAQAEEPQEEMVWIPASGSKYHSNSSCSGMNNPTQVTKSDAEARGYTPCKRCH